MPQRNKKKKKANRSNWRTRPGTEAAAEVALLNRALQAVIENRALEAGNESEEVPERKASSGHSNLRETQSDSKVDALSSSGDVMREPAMEEMDLPQSTGPTIPDPSPTIPEISFDKVLCPIVSSERTISDNLIDEVLSQNRALQDVSSSSIVRIPTSTGLPPPTFEKDVSPSSIGRIFTSAGLAPPNFDQDVSPISVPQLLDSVVLPRTTFNQDVSSSSNSRISTSEGLAPPKFDQDVSPISVAQLLDSVVLPRTTFNQDVSSSSNGRISTSEGLAPPNFDQDVSPISVAQLLGSAVLPKTTAQQYVSPNSIGRPRGAAPLTESPLLVPRGCASESKDEDLPSPEHDDRGSNAERFVGTPPPGIGPSPPGSSGHGSLGSTELPTLSPTRQNQSPGSHNAACSSSSSDIIFHEDITEEVADTKPFILIAIDSLRHGVFSSPEGTTIRLTHKEIQVLEVILHSDSFELHFTTRNQSDAKLLREFHDPDLSEIPEGVEFVWHLPLEHPVQTDSLTVNPSSTEFFMRKSTEGVGTSRELGSRLSASTSSIRARDYSRSYGTGSYRYTPSSHAASSVATSYSTLTRSPSSAMPTAYHRSLFTPTSKASAMLPSSTTTSALSSSVYQKEKDPRDPYSSYTSARTMPYSPMKYSASTYSTSASHSQPSDRHYTTFTSTLGREKLASSSGASDHRDKEYSRESREPYAQSIGQPSTRSRSSSAVGTYRTVNVAELCQKAAERQRWELEREEKQQWEEREKERPTMTEPLVKDFRKKMTPGGSSLNVTTTPSGRYSPAPPPYETSPPYISIKPTAKVLPYDERGTVVQPGFTGLRNIGNTCFMNATLQMLVNIIELKTYFLKDFFKQDINSHNPLGFNGRLATAFADFMQQMWSCTARSTDPHRIKELVAEKASQFANFAQHDAHEFLSFLLDGLHEDLNRVKIKAITGNVEADGRPDIEVANEAWGNHLLRNNSIFVDLFHGQLKSRLQCPKCNRVSITFDPFVYLAVPFPKLKKSIMVYFWPLDPLMKPVKIAVNYSVNGTIYDFLNVVGDLTRAPARSLRLIEIVAQRIHKAYQFEDRASNLGIGDLLYVFQVHSPNDCNEEVVEINVVQRQLFPPNLRYSCSSCGKSMKSMKNCEGCYNAYYCDEECQTAHWNSGGHRENCLERGNVAIEMVGMPFIVSLPRSKCTPAHLFRVMEARSRFSVEIFQPPTTYAPLAEVEEVAAKQEWRSSDSHHSNSNVVEVNGLTSPEKSCSSSSLPVPEAGQTSAPSHSTPRPSGQKRQIVLPERREKTTKDVPMFHIWLVKDQDKFQGVPIDPDPSDEPMNIPSGSTFAISWMNIKNGKPHVQVDTRQILDVDEEKTKHYAALHSSLTCSRDPTLQDMLSMFSETERLKPEESWYCNRCKEHVEATKRLEMYRLPPILIIQLKRFVYTASLTTMHRRSKDERKVVYPLSDLNLAPFLAEDAPVELPPIYDLTGVVCHMGSSHFGHYVSAGRLAGFDASKTEIDWRTFDDSVVAKGNPQSAKSDDAYLLFYKQRGLATRSVFTRHYSFDPAKQTNEEREGTPEANGF